MLLLLLGLSGSPPGNGHQRPGRVTLRLSVTHVGGHSCKMPESRGALGMSLAVVGRGCCSWEGGDRARGLQSSGELPSWPRARVLPDW